eukprot:6183077-Pleurochrysis_carterae.AAC.2
MRVPPFRRTALEARASISRSTSRSLARLSCGRGRTRPLSSLVVSGADCSTVRWAAGSHDGNAVGAGAGPCPSCSCTEGSCLSVTCACAAAGGGFDSSELGVLCDSIFFSSNGELGGVLRDWFERQRAGTGELEAEWPDVAATEANTVGMLRWSAWLELQLEQVLSATGEAPGAVATMKSSPADTTTWSSAKISSSSSICGET